MENLKALVHGKTTNQYQRALALNEFNNLMEKVGNLLKEDTPQTNESLVLSSLQVELIDREGDFEINLLTGNSYTYISTEEAEQLISFLQAQISKYNEQTN